MSDTGPWQLRASFPWPLPAASSMEPHAPLLVTRYSAHTLRDWNLRWAPAEVADVWKGQTLTSLESPPPACACDFTPADQAHLHFPVSIHLPLPWLHLELHHPNLQPIPLLQQDPAHHDAVTTLPLYQRPPGGPFQLCLCGILYKGYFALDMQGHYEVSCPPGTLADTSDEAPSSILTNYLPLPGTRWHSLKEEAHSLCIPCMLHSLIL